MRKRIYLVAAVCMFGALTLAGCGDKKQGESVSDTETAQDALDYNVEDYVKLGDYKNLNVQYPVPTVTQEDIEMYIEEQLDDNTEYREITDRPAQKGDNVNIDYTGTVGGEEFEGGSDTEFDLVLGSGEFLEDFENGLIGKKSGETVTLPVDFPKDYDDKDMAGKTAEFTITINSISEVIVPEYNDAFVAEISDYNTTEEYEDSIREELMISYEEESVTAAGEDALALAIENAEIKGYPQALYDACYDETIEGYQFYAEMMGVDFEEFLSEYMSEDDVEEITVSTVNEIMVAKAIAEKEGFEITDKNYQSEAEELVLEYEYDSLEDFENDYGKTYIVNTLLREKAIDFLYNSANIEEVSQEEYYGDDDDEDEEEMLYEDTEE